MLERSGGGPGTPVGRIALIDGGGPVYCNNFCQQLRFDTSHCSPQYAVRALWHRYLRGVTARLEHQTTGIRNLDYSGYLTFPYPLPNLAEQRTIAALMNGIDETIECAREESQANLDLRAATAEVLLTGTVSVHGGSA